MKDNKNWVMVGLGVVICIMAVAYAAFATTLTINGTATIDSSWCVQIVNEEITCQSTPAVGGAPGSVTATATRESNILATVNMTFTQPGDTATCTIKFENCGDLKAKLNKIDITGIETETPIKFEVTKPELNTPLVAKGSNHEVTIKGTYVDTITSQPSTLSQEVNVVAEYVQDMSTD